MQNILPLNSPQNNPSHSWKIYKIVSKRDAATIYIGSTKQEMALRLKSHKYEAKNPEANISKDNWMLENYDDLEIIEINRADSKKEALYREREEILNHVEQGYKVLNMQLPDIFPVPEERTITYELQYRRCGRSACKACRNEASHGPYWYAYWREGGRVKSKYIGKIKPV